MNGDDVARLLSVAANVWPAMRLEEHTVEAWAMVLDDVPYTDAADALRVIARSQHTPPAVSDVMREVRKVWDQREAAGQPGTITPNVDPDDTRAYAAEVGAIRKAVRRGTFDPVAYSAGGVCLARGATPRPVRGPQRHRDVQRALASAVAR